ncbi:MAG: cupin domain-containing protein [Solirubrobacterales bacterium]
MSGLEPAPPGPVAAASARRRVETEDGGFEIGIVIDAESHGSPLLLGLEWIQPGTEVSTWSADAETHETYYVERGRLRIGWTGAEAGEATLGPSDCFYFPPGGTYSAENVGEDEVLVIWSLVPSPPPSSFQPTKKDGWQQ